MLLDVWNSEQNEDVVILYSSIFTYVILLWAKLANHRNGLF